MPKHPRLHRRKGSNNYYFRTKVPVDLLDHYGKQEITFSLRTSVYRDALERVRMESVKLDQEFTEIRRQKATQPVHSLSSVEIERLTSLWLHTVLEEDEEERMLGMDDRAFRKSQEAIDINEAGSRHSLARGDTQFIEFEVDDLLESHGIKLDKGSDAYRTFSYAMLKTWTKAVEMMKLRQLGEVVDTPPQPTPIGVASGAFQTSSGAPTITQAHEMWAEEHRAGGGPEATIQDFGTHIHRFVELHGDLSVTQITKAHVRQFKDAMLKYPTRPSHKFKVMTVPQLLEYGERNPDAFKTLSPRTVNDKCMGAVGAVLGWATDNAYLEYNPASGVKVKAGKVRETARLPYSIEDMGIIFRFPIYTDDERPQGGGGEAAKWLPLLAAFTGARLEELGQLTVEDIKEERSVTYFDMTIIEEGKRRKTESSKRRVPVHPELVRLGFLVYAQSAGEGRLFPDLTCSNEKVTTAWSQWWGRYARKHGGFDKLKTFHSFRHSVKDGFRECNVPEDISDAITGHKKSTVGREYGSGYSLMKLDEAMKKLSYPGLQLPE